MIKTPEGLEKWLGDVAKKQMVNATQFETFDFEYKEFDNIPMIIPRFLFHLNTQVRGVCDHLLKLSKEETTKDLRADLVERIVNINKEFKEMKQDTIYHLSVQTIQHKDQIQELKERVDTIQKNQETSGSLELQNMLRAPNLSMLSERTEHKSNVKISFQEKSKGEEVKDEEQKKLKTKRNSK